MNAILLTLLGFFPPPGVFGEPVAVAPLVQTREATLVVVAPPEVPVVWPGARRVAARGLPMLGDLSGPGGTLRIYEDAVLPGVPTSVATDGASVVVVGGVLGDFFGRRIDPGGVVRHMPPPYKDTTRLWAGLAPDQPTLAVYRLTGPRHDFELNRSVWPVTVDRVQRYGGLQTVTVLDWSLDEPAQVCASDGALWTVRPDAQAGPGMRRAFETRPDQDYWQRKATVRRLLAAAPALARAGCASQVGPLRPEAHVIESAGRQVIERALPDLPAFSDEKGLTRTPFPATAPPGVRFDAGLLGFPWQPPSSPASSFVPRGGPLVDDGPWTAESADAEPGDALDEGAAGPFDVLDEGAGEPVGAPDAEYL